MDTTEHCLESLYIRRNTYGADRKEKPYSVEAKFKRDTAVIELTLSGELASRVFAICQEELVNEVVRVSDKARDAFIAAAAAVPPLIEAQPQQPPQPHQQGSGDDEVIF